MPMQQAAAVGDVFITLTGGKSGLDRHHFEVMKDGAIMANSGHFNVEINIPALEEMAEAKREARNFVDEYTMEDGRRLNLLAEGRLVNLSAAEGHPSGVMDMSFANQALATEYVVKQTERLSNGVHPMPEEIDRDIARLKLQAMGMEMDTLTDEQRKYLASWTEGT
jgi:adenosylhomocysteinase